MSVTARTFSFVKMMMTYQERLDGLEGRLVGLSDSLVRLSDSHVALRERVSRIEGLIDGAAMARGRQPRIEG